MDKPATHAPEGPYLREIEKVPFWLDPKKRALFYQFGVFCMVGLLAYYLVSNTITNLQRQHIATGFGFLHKEASFEIGESLISYSAASTYGRALLVWAPSIPSRFPSSELYLP